MPNSPQLPSSSLEMNAAASQEEDSETANAAVGDAEPGTPHCPPSPFQNLKYTEIAYYLFTMEVKLANEPQVYQSFFNILNELKSEIIDEIEVHKRVRHLFRDHDDNLIVGFNTLIPPTLMIDLAHEDAVNYLNKVQFTFTSQPQAYTDLLDTMKEFQSHSIHMSLLKVRVAHLLKDHIELLVEFSNIFLPPHCEMEVQDNNQVNVSTDVSQAPVPLWKRLAIIDVLSYLNQVQLKFANQPADYRSFLFTLVDFKTKKRPAKISRAFEDLARLLKGHPDLIVGFNKLCPPNLRIRTRDEALSYLNQVMLALENGPVVYDAFVDLMKDLISNIINIPIFIDRVAFLFKDYPQLFDGFNMFLPHGYKIEVLDNNQVNVLIPTWIAAHMSRNRSNSAARAQPQLSRRRSGPEFVIYFPLASTTRVTINNRRLSF